VLSAYPPSLTHHIDSINMLRKYSLLLIIFVVILKLFWLFVIHYSFYMPHGLAIDGNNSIWITDVALHQVSC